MSPWRSQTRRQRAARLIMANIWLRPETWGDEWQEIWDSLTAIADGLEGGAS